MSCPECFQGSIHPGQPHGEIVKLHGLDTYVAQNTNGRPVKGIIVIIPDAFGWDFVNGRLLADHLAAKGDYTIYLPDFMNGYSAPVAILEQMHTALSATNYLSKVYNFVKAAISFIPWILRNRVGKTWPGVRGFFEQLRKDEGATLPIGAAGYCWGGKHTLLLSHGAEIDGEPLIDAGFTGHPSFVSIPSDIEKITVPVSVAIGDRDNQISVAQAEAAKAILMAKPEHSRGELRIYDNTSHGFCVRAAFEVEGVEEKATEAEDQCIAWFDAHLVRSG